MRLFAIDHDGAITAFPAAEQIPEGQEHFASEKELAKLAANGAADRLVQIWNGFAGVAPFQELKPVKKFTDRKTAVARVWKAIQRLDDSAVAETTATTPETATTAPQAAQVAPKKAKTTKGAKTKKGKPTAREGSKKAIVIELLRRKDGATRAHIAKVSSWQPHTIRGFISTLSKKLGLQIESSQNQAGERTYRLPS